MPCHARVLIVAHLTASSATLRAAVRRRAQEGDATFVLLVPARRQANADRNGAGSNAALARLRAALSPLSEAAGSNVVGYVGDADPIVGINDALVMHGFDEIIVSTLPRRLSRWMQLDIPSKARTFGLPVTHVEVQEAARALL